MKSEIYAKIDELESENVVALKELNRLQSPNNRLSSDPVQRKNQMSELRKAKVKAQTTAAAINKLYSRIADIEADELVS